MMTEAAGSDKPSIVDEPACQHASCHCMRTYISWLCKQRLTLSIRVSGPLVMVVIAAASAHIQSHQAADRCCHCLCSQLEEPSRLDADANLACCLLERSSPPRVPPQCLACREAQDRLSGGCRRRDVHVLPRP